MIDRSSTHSHTHKGENQLDQYIARSIVYKLQLNICLVASNQGVDDLCIRLQPKKSDKNKAMTIYNYISDRYYLLIDDYVG